MDSLSHTHTREGHVRMDTEECHVKKEADAGVTLRQGRGSQRLKEPRGDPSLQPSGGGAWPYQQLGGGLLDSRIVGEYVSVLRSHLVEN